MYGESKNRTIDVKMREKAEICLPKELEWSIMSVAKKEALEQSV